MMYKQIVIDDSDLGQCPICSEGALELWLDEDRKSLISYCSECGRHQKFTLSSLMNVQS